MDDVTITVTDADASIKTTTREVVALTSTVALESKEAKGLNERASMLLQRLRQLFGKFSKEPSVVYREDAEAGRRILIY